MSVSAKAFLCKDVCQMDDNSINRHEDASPLLLSRKIVCFVP